MSSVGLSRLVGLRSAVTNLVHLQKISASSTTFITLRSSQQLKPQLRRYDVRMAFIHLDAPPIWFSISGEDHMSANEARNYAGTDGKCF